MPSACGPDCTTRQHNTHRTEEREVLYPWHRWFGRRVFVHEVLVRGNGRVFRCSETVQAAVSWLIHSAYDVRANPRQEYAARRSVRVAHSMLKRRRTEQ